jgi:hypothetical protein
MTSTLLKEEGPAFISPDKVLAGTKEESSNAGYDPEPMAVSRRMAIIPTVKRVFE